MSHLILARRDIDFLLYEWLGVDALTRRAAFVDHSHHTFETSLDLYERLAVELFEPHNKTNDRVEPQVRGEEVFLNPEIDAALRAFADAGLFAAVQPAELGGMGLPHVVERAGMAFMMAANSSSTAYAFLTQANINLLLAFGSAEQHETFVRPMLAGRYFGTMCLSEPHAGSSLSEISSRAIPQPGGGYRVFGSKMWISGGDHEMGENIVHLLLAKIPAQDGRLPAGTQGLSLFIVPRMLPNGGVGHQRNDIALVGLNHKMGQRGTVNCALNFGDGKFKPGGMPGAVAQLVGKPGRGLEYMFRMMNEARIAVGLGATALGCTGYLHALDYARNRVQGHSLQRTPGPNLPVRIIEHPDVRRMLLAQKAYAEGALALVLYCAKLLDDSETLAGESVRQEATQLLELLTPIAKSWPSQWCLAANDLAIQVHGGYGYTRDYAVEQFYRDNRINAIHEGTHGIQALDLLGRKVRLNDGAALTSLGDRMKQAANAARDAAELLPYAESLTRAWEAVLGVTRALHSMPDASARLGNASAYLEAFGHVTVAYLWLEQALAARAALAARPADEAFYRGKLMACRFFFRWELPRVSGWLAVLQPLDTTCIDMQPAWF